MKQLQHFLGLVYQIAKVMARVRSSAIVRAALAAILFWCEFIFVEAVGEHSKVKAFISCFIRTLLKTCCIIGST